MKRLVITADDLGLTPDVNAAIERAYRAGIVTQASLLAVGSAFDDAVAMAQRNPGLAIGAHLALVGEDPPLLGRAAVGSLVDEAGQFPLSYRTVCVRGGTGRLRTEHIRAEFAAQLDRIYQAGIEVAHLDTHQHTQLWPQVAKVVCELARERGIAYVRVPCSRARNPLGWGVNVLAAALRRRVRRAGLVTTDTYAGLDEAGSMTTERLVTTIATVLAARGDSAEINAHPGSDTDPQAHRFAWGYHWGDELAALVSPQARAACEQGQAHLLAGRDLA